MSSKVTKNMFRKGKQLLALLLTAVMTLGCFSSTAFAEMKPIVEKEVIGAGDLGGEIYRTSETFSIYPGDSNRLGAGNLISFAKYIPADGEEPEEWDYISVSSLVDEGRLTFVWKKNGAVLADEKHSFLDVSYGNPGNYTCDVIVDGKLWTTLSFNLTQAKITDTLVAGKSNQTIKEGWYKITVSKKAEYRFAIPKITTSTDLYIYNEDERLNSVYGDKGENLAFEQYLKAGGTYYLHCLTDDYQNQSISIELTDAAKADQAVLDAAKAEAAAAKKAQAVAEAAKATAEARAVSTAVPAKLTVSVKAAKKALTVKWNKQAGVTGYEIQVATNKKFTKNLKTVKVKKAGTASKKIKKLKPKKKYFVRARAYKKVSGGSIIGAWSKVVKKKTK